jgi:hypothetical protein
MEVRYQLRHSPAARRAGNSGILANGEPDAKSAQGPDEEVLLTSRART